METSNIKTDWLFWGGIVVGIFVMIVGIVTLMWRNIDTASARLILCSGLGILFGAFGAAAVVKYKGLTITGVAAIAIARLYVVVILTKSQITFGTITGDIKGALIEIKGDQTYLGATRGRSYDFVIEGSSLKRPVFDVYINFPPGTSGQEGEIPFEDIDKKYIERFIGSGYNIEWRFDRTKGTLVDTATGEVIRELRLPRLGLPQPLKTGRGAWLFVGEALAQAIPRSIEEIFADLGSGVASVRRAARDELASKGPRVVDATMQYLREHDSEYSIRLGILVALTTMLRNDKSLAQEVSNHLAPEDLEIIVKGLNDPDRTIRIYAGEFLFDLGDPRIVPLALAAAGDADASPDGLYLSIFVIKGAHHRLSPSEKQTTREKLQAIRPKAGPETQRLIDSLTM
jgi:hypothetical protein